MSFKKNIPYGIYCYRIKKVVKDEKYGFILKTKVCPYFQYLDDGEVACSFLGIQGTKNDLLLMDQVKICGENELDDEFDLEEKGLTDE